MRNKECRQDNQKVHCKWIQSNQDVSLDDILLLRIRK